MPSFLPRSPIQAFATFKDSVATLSVLSIACGRLSSSTKLCANACTIRERFS